MKVKLIRECESPNPFYDAAEHREANEAGKPYDYPPYIKRKPGETIDDPQAWLLCMVQANNRPALAVPVDAAAKKKVDAGNARFKARLKQMEQHLAMLSQQLPKDKAGNLKPRNEKEDRFLETCEAYGLYSPSKK